MNLVSMRSAFKRHSSGLADSMSDSDVDEYLNNIYAEFLPGEIDGKLHEVTWVVTLAVDVNPIVIPNHIVAFPSGHFWIQGTSGNRTGSIFPLSFCDHLADFVLENPAYQDPANRGRPTEVLRQGRKLFFDVFPDDDYNLISKARGSSAAALTTDGLPFPHAMAVITAAAWNYLIEQEDEAGILREATQYETWKERLLIEGHSDYHGRTHNRSF